MKKRLALLLTMCLFALFSEASAEVVGVTANGTMETPYHQLTRLFVEYSEEIVAPDMDTYQVIDFATAELKEDYECRPFDVGVITDVYTNTEAAVREDKTSVPGKFVVIEMAGTDGSYVDETEQLWKPKNITGIATWREVGKSSQYVRTDWSMFIVAQTKDVVNAEGTVVASKCILPSLPNEPVYTPEIAEAFTQQFLPAANGTHNINYNIRLPKNYDETKEYPVMFVQSGGGGGLNYEQQGPNGELLCQACDLTLDAVAIEFVRAREDLIVVAFQRWKNPPAEWEVDDVSDYIQLNEYIRANYAVDQDRVYALGSSAGTMNTSQAISRRPDLWNGYVQCNGSYMYLDENGETQRFTLFKDELMISYTGYTADQIWEISNDPTNRLDQAVIDETGKTFDGVVEYRVPIYFFDGTNTQSGSSLNTSAAYLYLKERYEALGLSTEEIDELIKVAIVDDADFHKVGVCEYHASSKVAVTDGFDVIDWILSR